MISAVIALMAISTKPFIIMIGILAHVIYLVSNYINSIKHPFIVSCREFTRMFLKLMFTKSSYRRMRYDVNATRKGNAYVDNLLKELRENGEHDPYILEDRVIGFNRRVLSVGISGEAKLHDGYIRGLNTLHRMICSLIVDGDNLLITAHLGVGLLHLSYSGSAKFLNFGPEIVINGVSSFMEVHMEFIVYSETGNNGTLEKFIIEDMRGMKVWVTGLGPLNWAVNLIISGFTKIFRRFFRNVVENRVNKHIAECLSNFTFPAERSELIEDNSKGEREETNSDESSSNLSTELQETHSSEPGSSTIEEQEETNSHESETNTTERSENVRPPKLDSSPIEEPGETISKELQSSPSVEPQNTNLPKSQTNTAVKVEAITPSEPQSYSAENEDPSEDTAIMEPGSELDNLSLSSDDIELNSQESETNISEEANSPEPDSSPIEELEGKTSREVESSTSMEPQDTNLLKSQIKKVEKVEEIAPTEPKSDSAENEDPSEDYEIRECDSELDNISSSSEDEMETSQVSCVSD